MIALSEKAVAKKKEEKTVTKPREKKEMKWRIVGVIVLGKF